MDPRINHLLSGSSESVLNWSHTSLYSCSIVWDVLLIDALLVMALDFLELLRVFIVVLLTCSRWVALDSDWLLLVVRIAVSVT